MTFIVLSDETLNADTRATITTKCGQKSFSKIKKINNRPLWVSTFAGSVYVRDQLDNIIDLALVLLFRRGLVLEWKLLNEGAVGSFIWYFRFFGIVIYYNLHLERKSKFFYFLKAKNIKIERLTRKRFTFIGSGSDYLTENHIEQFKEYALSVDSLYKEVEKLDSCSNSEYETFDLKSWKYVKKVEIDD